MTLYLLYFRTRVDAFLLPSVDHSNLILELICQ